MRSDSWGSNGQEDNSTTIKIWVRAAEIEFDLQNFHLFLTFYVLTVGKEGTSSSLPECSDCEAQMWRPPQEQEVLRGWWGGEVCVGQEHLAGSRGFAHLILIPGTHPGALDLALSPKIHPLLWSSIVHHQPFIRHFLHQTLISCLPYASHFHTHYSHQHSDSLGKVHMVMST
jgi:hypothetical protein